MKRTINNYVFFNYTIAIENFFLDISDTNKQTQTLSDNMT